MGDWVGLTFTVRSSQDISLAALGVQNMQLYTAVGLHSDAGELIQLPGRR